MGRWDVSNPLVEGCGPCDVVGSLQMIVWVVPVEGVEIGLLVKRRKTKDALASERAEKGMFALNNWESVSEGRSRTHRCDAGRTRGPRINDR